MEDKPSFVVTIVAIFESGAGDAIKEIRLEKSSADVTSRNLKLNNPNAMHLRLKSCYFLNRENLETENLYEFLLSCSPHTLAHANR